MSTTIFILIVIALLAISMFRIIPEYERAIVFRFGRVLEGPRGPGIIFLIPLVDRIEARVSNRTVTMDIPPQDVITKDNISLKVNAVVYFRAVDPMRAVLNVENYLYATTQVAQTHLRSVLGEHSMDDLLSEREAINRKLQIILDQNTDPWGIKVSAVEVKHVDLPPDMQRAMARQAEAERERRAKIIAAEGERQAAQTLRDAADTLAGNPAALQLRYLQTMSDMSTEQNSKTIFFPFPIDLLETIKSFAAKKP
ncbi:MAG: slipin family protein [Proteobacteria bacterium]|nr:MAG: slipin family protein [Pseudomonadota bacterium]